MNKLINHNGYTLKLQKAEYTEDEAKMDAQIYNSLNYRVGIRYDSSAVKPYEVYVVVNPRTKQPIQFINGQEVN